MVKKRVVYVTFVFIYHNIRFHALENECVCYSNIHVFSSPFPLHINAWYVVCSTENKVDEELSGL